MEGKLNRIWLGLILLNDIRALLGSLVVWILFCWVIYMTWVIMGASCTPVVFMLTLCLLDSSEAIIVFVNCFSLSKHYNLFDYYYYTSLTPRVCY